jgi:hypothetical protein
MALPSPLSIGDAILLSQLAYSLARAFTSGRKSAPAEFQEVQNQLYGLGSALEFIAKDRTESSSRSGVGDAETVEKEKEADEQEDVLERMLSNFLGNLKHLELLVGEYMEIDPNAKDSGQTGLRRWQQDVKRNWKKIQWTTEGGDLEKLRNNLAVHINGLNLALSAMHRCVSE